MHRMHAIVHRHVYIDKYMHAPAAGVGSMGWCSHIRLSRGCSHHIPAEEVVPRGCCPCCACPYSPAGMVTCRRDRSWWHSTLLSPVWVCGLRWRPERFSLAFWFIRRDVHISSGCCGTNLALIPAVRQSEGWHFFLCFALKTAAQVLQGPVLAVFWEVLQTSKLQGHLPVTRSC